MICISYYHKQYEKPKSTKLWAIGMNLLPYNTFLDILSLLTKIFQIITVEQLSTQILFHNKLLYYYQTKIIIIKSGK